MAKIKNNSYLGDRHYLVEVGSIDIRKDSEYINHLREVEEGNRRGPEGMIQSLAGHYSGKTGNVATAIDTDGMTAADIYRRLGVTDGGVDHDYFVGARRDGSGSLTSVSFYVRRTAGEILDRIKRDGLPASEELSKDVVSLLRDNNVIPGKIDFGKGNRAGEWYGEVEQLYPDDDRPSYREAYEEIMALDPQKGLRRMLEIADGLDIPRHHPSLIETSRDPGSFQGRKEIASGVHIGHGYSYYAEGYKLILMNADTKEPYVSVQRQLSDTEVRQMVRNGIEDIRKNPGEYAGSVEDLAAEMEKDGSLKDGLSDDRVFYAPVNMLPASRVGGAENFKEALERISSEEDRYLDPESVVPDFIYKKNELERGISAENNRIAISYNPENGIYRLYYKLDEQEVKNALTNSAYPEDFNLSPSVQAVWDKMRRGLPDDTRKAFLMPQRAYDAGSINGKPGEQLEKAVRNNIDRTSLSEIYPYSKIHLNEKVVMEDSNWLLSYNSLFNTLQLWKKMSGKDIAARLSSKGYEGYSVEASRNYSPVVKDIASELRRRDPEQRMSMNDNRQNEGSKKDVSPSDMEYYTLAHTMDRHPNYYEDSETKHFDTMLKDEDTKDLLRYAMEFDKDDGHELDLSHTFKRSTPELGLDDRIVAEGKGFIIVHNDSYVPTAWRFYRQASKQEVLDAARKAKAKDPEAGKQFSPDVAALLMYDKLEKSPDKDEKPYAALISDDIASDEVFGLNPDDLSDKTIEKMLEKGVSMDDGNYNPASIWDRGDIENHSDLKLLSSRGDLRLYYDRENDEYPVISLVSKKKAVETLMKPEYGIDGNIGQNYKISDTMARLVSEIWDVAEKPDKDVEKEKPAEKVYYALVGNPEVEKVGTSGELSSMNPDDAIRKSASGIDDYQVRATHIYDAPFWPTGTITVAETPTHLLTYTPGDHDLFLYEKLDDRRAERQLREEGYSKEDASVYPEEMQEMAAKMREKDLAREKGTVYLSPAWGRDTLEDGSTYLKDSPRLSEPSVVGAVDNKVSLGLPGREIIAFVAGTLHPDYRPNLSYVSKDPIREDIEGEVVASYKGQLLVRHHGEEPGENYYMLYGEHSGKEIKDAVRSDIRQKGMTVPDYYSEDAQAIAGDIVKEEAGKQNKKAEEDKHNTRTVSLPKPGEGRWHQKDQNLLRAYNEIGEAFSQWLRSYAGKEPFPKDYYYRDGNPVNSLMLSIWSQMNGYSHSVYITKEQAVDAGVHIDCFQKSVPYITDSGDVLRVYNIEQTEDYIRHKTIPEQFKSQSEQQRDFQNNSAYQERMGIESLVAGSNWRASVNVVSALDPEAVSKGYHSAYYDREKDTVFVLDPSEDDYNDDVRKDEIMSALTDSMFIGGKVRQSNPQDMAYFQTARLMNAINSGIAIDRTMEDYEPSMTGRPGFDRLQTDPLFTKDVLEKSAAVSSAIESRSLGYGDSLQEKGFLSKGSEAALQTGQEVKENSEEREPRHPSLGM